MFIFDTKLWSKKIADPFWYFDVPDVIRELKSLHDQDRSEYENEKEKIYDFFEEQLRLSNIALGSQGEDFDRERKPIDTIIIHHTSNLPGLSKDRLSAIELVRLYAPQFAGSGPTYDANKEIKGAPIYSGHWRDGVQVFWPYHWVIRSDGTCERLLNDDEIGWQAGNWDINCRSIAICIDDDHENTVPDAKILKVIAGLIKKNYPQVPKDRIFGHCEINKKTTCPSKLFLSTQDKRGWKDDLVGLL